MDSVSHPTNVVMETRSVLMAVMNSSAVSQRWKYHCLNPRDVYYIGLNPLPLLQILHVVGGHATMDSVSHPTSVVMDTGSAQMAVMNSVVVHVSTW